MKNKKVLIAPQYWGMGHTTRCFPVILYFLQNHYDVFVAGNQAQQYSIQKKFENEQIHYLSIEGYDIKYAKHAQLFFLKLLTQLPTLIKTILNEKKQIDHWQKIYQFDIIVSDSRLNFYNRDALSIIIIHLLKIKSRLGFVVDNFLQKIIYHFINKFDKVWIPDHYSRDLSGELSKFENNKTHYIGWLSHISSIPNVGYKTDILVILSGPEPQRTLFYNTLKNVLKTSTFTFDIVGQKDGTEQFLSSDALSQKIAESRYIITRSGYSTLMDLASIGRTALLIPTPNQPEQEYLAKYLSPVHFLTLSQKEINLKNIIQKISQLDNTKPISLPNFKLATKLNEQFY